VRSEIAAISDGSGRGFPPQRLFEREMRDLFFGVNSVDTCFEHVAPALRYLNLLGGMQSLNLKLEPTVTDGQDYDNEIGEAYAQFISRTAQAVTQAQRMDDLDLDGQMPKQARAQ